MFFEKKISDSDFKKYHGKNFDNSWYEYVISDSSDGYYTDSSGNKKVLFKFRKNVINDSLQELAIKSYLKEAKKKHSNRGMAAGIGLDGNARHYTKNQNKANEINKVGIAKFKYAFFGSTVTCKFKPIV